MRRTLALNRGCVKRAPTPYATLRSGPGRLRLLLLGRRLAERDRLCPADLHGDDVADRIEALADDPVLNTGLEVERHDGDGVAQPAGAYFDLVHARRQLDRLLHRRRAVDAFDAD